MKTFRKLFLPIAAVMLVSCATTGVDSSPSPKKNNVIKLSHKAQIAFDRNEISFLTYLNNGQREQAKINLDKMEMQLDQVDKSKLVDFSFYKASYLLSVDLIDEALLEFDKCLQLDATNLQALFSKAHIAAYSKKNYELAEVQFEKIISFLDSDLANSEVISENLSHFHFNLNKATFKIKIRPSYTNKALSEVYNGPKFEYNFTKRDYAIKGFKKFIHTQIYDSALQRDDYSKAINTLKNILKLDPEERKHLSTIAVLSLKLKNYEQAEIYFTKAIESGVRKFDFYASRGKCRYHQKNYTSALLDFEECLKINGSNALLSEQHKYYRGSKEAIDTSIKGNDGPIPNLRNKLTEVQYLKARSQDKLGRKDEAFDTLTALLRYNKSHAMAFYHRGFYYNDKKDPMRAVKDFRRALDRDASLTSLYYEIAKNYDDFKMYKEGKNYYKLFLEKDKNKGSKKHQLAQLRLKQLRSN